MPHELRTVITVDDFDKTVEFYRDALEMPIVSEWDRGDGRGVLLDAGRATLEIFDHEQRRSIDMLEAGRPVSGDVRLAIKVDDVDETFHRAVLAGASLMSHPLVAPWGDRVARLEAPHGLQLTLFQ
jgi:catechol 2,3-dioxygenase-like lactoylglutathione lyase family enzyme